MTTPTLTWPGLGFDPAPGDPSGAAGLSRQLTDTARHLHETHAVLTQLREQRGSWTGEASRAFATKVEALPGYLDKAQESLRRAGGVLGEWQSRLGGLQGRARDLETRAADARSRLVGAQDVERQARAHPDLGLAGQLFATDPELAEANRRIAAAQGEVDRAVRTAQALRSSLEDLLWRGEALRTEHGDEARRTADAVRKADDGLAPPEPGWFEEAVTWVGENLGTIGDVAGMVSSVAGALALIPVLTPFAGPVALIAGGVALLAHGADLVVNEKWDDPGAYLDIGADIAGLVPGGKIIGAAGEAAWSTLNSASDLVPALSAGWTAARAAVPDVVAGIGEAGPLAERVGNRVAPWLDAQFPSRTVDPEAVAKAFQGATQVVPEVPTVAGWISGEEYAVAEDAASLGGIGHAGADGVLGRIDRAAAAAAAAAT